jgi:hypothetical protein
MLKRLVFAASLALVAPLPSTAQDSTQSKPESEKKGMMDDHMMGPWKEMNAFHRVMGATWHPASSRGDLAPIRAQAKQFLAAADAWAASMPPAHPASCGTKEVRAAVTKVAADSKALLALVDSGADDARVRSALKGVHDTFEVAEKACGGHGK